VKTNCLPILKLKWDSVVESLEDKNDVCYKSVYVIALLECTFVSLCRGDEGGGGETRCTPHVTAILGRTLSSAGT
jgi:hypothetical protein